MEMKHDTPLPETVPFLATYRCVLDHVVDAGYCSLRDSSNYGEKEDFDNDLANAVDEAAALLGLIDVETGDWKGELYDVAEELGFAWSDEDDDEDD